MLLAIPVWANVHPLRKVLPMEWEYSIPHGDRKTFPVGGPGRGPGAVRTADSTLRYKLMNKTRLLRRSRSVYAGKTETVSGRKTGGQSCWQAEGFWDSQHVRYGQ